MRLLFLCKRFPQGRDLLSRPYGRYYYLPRLLADLGHEVRIGLLSHHRLPSENAEVNGISWTSDDFFPMGPVAYLSRQVDVVRSWKPDWIIGGSDIYFGITAVRLARRYSIRSAIDAYDDFEAYMPWAKPLHWAWRRALRQADLVTAPGPQLAQRLSDSGARQTSILPMAADPGFVPMDRSECRQKLGLPLDRKLVGQIGAFDRRRGDQIVLAAMEHVRARRHDVSLVLTGRRSLALHAPPDVIGLGYLADEDLPAAVNSLDVACVSLADNRFCRSSYPAKLCEGMACGIPVVASDLPTARSMLKNEARFLAAVGMPEQLAERIIARLGDNRIYYGKLPAWPVLAKTYERMLLARH